MSGTMDTLESWRLRQIRDALHGDMSATSDSPHEVVEELLEVAALAEHLVIESDDLHVDEDQRGSFTAVPEYECSALRELLRLPANTRSQDERPVHLWVVTTGDADHRLEAAFRSQREADAAVADAGVDKKGAPKVVRPPRGTATLGWGLIMGTVLVVQAVEAKTPKAVLVKVRGRVEPVWLPWSVVEDSDEGPGDWEIAEWFARKEGLDNLPDEDTPKPPSQLDRLLNRATASLHAGDPVGSARMRKINCR